MKRLHYKAALHNIAADVSKRDQEKEMPPKRGRGRPVGSGKMKKQQRLEQKPPKTTLVDIEKKKQQRFEQKPPKSALVDMAAKFKQEKNKQQRLEPAKVCTPQIKSHSTLTKPMSLSSYYVFSLKN